MFDAFRSRCESDRSCSDRIKWASDPIKAQILARRSQKARKDLAHVLGQALGVLLLDGDQIRFVRQKPEKRVRLERSTTRHVRQVLRGLYPAAREVLAGLPRPPRRDGRNTESSGSSHFLRLKRL